MSEPGIESRIADLVRSKMALFTGLFDGTTDEVTFDRSGDFLSRIERIVAPATPPAPTREDASAPDDDAAEREIDAVVAAGDESGDVAIATASESEPSDAATTLRRLVAGVKVRRTVNGGLLIEAPPDTASTLVALFSGMAQLLQAAAAPLSTEKGPVGRR